MLLRHAKIIGLSILLIGGVVACNKQENSSVENTEVASNEPSQEQEPLLLTNKEGEKLSVTYFAQGDVVAVKIKKDGGQEHVLSAKGTSDSGNPVFTDGEYAWEMGSDGRSGKLTTKDHKDVVYQ